MRESAKTIRKMEEQAGKKFLDEVDHYVVEVCGPFLPAGAQSRGH